MRRVLAVVGACVAVILSGCSAVPDAGSTPGSGQQGSLTKRTSTGPATRSPSQHPSAGATADPTSRLRPRGPVSTGWRVTRVVDGDTVAVSRGARSLTLRLIGIDTPETVDPNAPVSCFGPQASAFAYRRLTGRPVALEMDRSQGRLDRYGRTLAYLWLGDHGKAGMYNLAALRRGYAVEYTYDVPYAWRPLFLHAQTSAERHDRGLWSPRTCGGDIHQPVSAAGPTSGGAHHGCAPGYRPCLPIRADLDCSQIDGPVRVTGADQYHLDADGDGIACES